MCLAIIIWLYHARTVLPVIYVCEFETGEEGEPEHSHTAADVLSCFSLPPIFHPGVYVISVHFLVLFPPLSPPKQTSICCILLMLEEIWRRQKLNNKFSGQFSDQYVTGTSKKCSFFLSPEALLQSKAQAIHESMFSNAANKQTNLWQNTFKTRAHRPHTIKLLLFRSVFFNVGSRPLGGRQRALGGS